MTHSESDVRDYIIDFARQVSRKISGGSDDVAISGATNLVGSGLLDSMAFMNFLVKLEDHFGVEIDLDDNEPSTFTSIDGLSRAVARSSHRDT